MADKAKEIYLTQSGLDDLKKELEYLRTEKRPEVINSLKEARALGDLSENAEYDAARAAQAEVEGRIKEIEVMLENVVVITGEKSDVASIGSLFSVSSSFNFIFLSLSSVLKNFTKDKSFFLFSGILK